MRMQATIAQQGCRLAFDKNLRRKTLEGEATQLSLSQQRLDRINPLFDIRPYAMTAPRACAMGGSS